MAKRNEERWGTDANVRWGTGRQRSGQHLRNTVSGRSTPIKILDSVDITIPQLKYLRCRNDSARCLKLTPAFYHWLKTRMLLQGKEFKAQYSGGIVTYSANTKADDVRSYMELGESRIAVKLLKMKPVTWEVVVSYWADVFR